MATNTVCVWAGLYGRGEVVYYTWGGETVQKDRGDRNEKQYTTWISGKPFS